jgi:hypothetical protein
MDSQRLNIIKIALATGADLEHEIFAQSKQETLDIMAKKYGVTCFNELSETQKNEVLNEYEDIMMSEANNLVQKIPKEASNGMNIKINEKGTAVSEDGGPIYYNPGFESLSKVGEVYGLQYHPQRQEFIRMPENQLLQGATSILLAPLGQKQGVQYPIRKSQEEFNASSSKMRKEAQSYWWSEQRYGDILNDNDKNALRNRIKDLLSSKNGWPKSHLINNDEAEEVLLNQFMDRFLNKMIPFRDDSYLEDDNVLDVCISMFLRNYPHIQAQYSNTFIPLQTTRHDEAENQEEHENSSFFSDTLPEKTAKFNLVVKSQRLNESKLEEGDNFLIKTEILDRNGKNISVGKYVLIDPPIEEEGSIILSLIKPEDVDDYFPDDVYSVEYPNSHLELID